MDKKNSQNGKLALEKTTLRDLTVRSGVRGGARPVTCPPYGTCVPYGTEGTSTRNGPQCCTQGGGSQ